jgi:hypothetical protein
MGVLGEGMGGVREGKVSVGFKFDFSLMSWWG